GIYSLPAAELLTHDAHLTAALLAAGHEAILARPTTNHRPNDTKRMPPAPRRHHPPPRLPDHDGAPHPAGPRHPHPQTRPPGQPPTSGQPSMPTPRATATPNATASRNQQLGPWQVDCLWPHQRLVVELDGRQHQRPHQSHTDDDRDLWLRRHGYTTRSYGNKQ